MSIYSSGVAAYRDTTKWLTAFVPAAALVSAVVTAGPSLVQSIQNATSVWGWVQSHWLVLLSAVAIFLGIAAILTWGAKVLSVEPADIADLVQDDKSKSKMVEAIGSGALAPYFFDKASFDGAMSNLANAWDDTSNPIKADDPRTARLQPALEALREWSVYHRIQKPFRNFLRIFTFATVLIFTAVLAAPIQLDPATAITKPTAVKIETNEMGRVELKDAAGCSDPGKSKFLAVGGTWIQPELAVDGPGCIFGATWRPDPAHIELRLP